MAARRVQMPLPGTVSHLPSPGVASGKSAALVAVNTAPAGADGWARLPALTLHPLAALSAGAGASSTSHSPAAASPMAVLNQRRVSRRCMALTLSPHALGGKGSEALSVKEGWGG